MAKVLAFLVLLLVSPTAYATQHTVGGTAGWSQAISTSNWVNGQTFVVGDTLVFNYGAAHAVDVVSSGDFQSCSSTSPIASYSPGPTTITLNTTGSWYFICPSTGHCAGGQRLTVNVTGAGGTTVPSTPSGRTTPPPSAAGGLGGGGLVSLVLMGVVGLMV